MFFPPVLALFPAVLGLLAAAVPRLLAEGAIALPAVRLYHFQPFPLHPDGAHSMLFAINRQIRGVAWMGNCGTEVELCENFERVGRPRSIRRYRIFELYKQRRSSRRVFVNLCLNYLFEIRIPIVYSCGKR